MFGKAPCGCQKRVYFFCKIIAFILENFWPGNRIVAQCSQFTTLLHFFWHLLCTWNNLLVKYADTLKCFGFFRSQWCRFQSWNICEEVQYFQYSHWEKTSEGFFFVCIPPSYMSFLESCKIYHYPIRNFSKNAINSKMGTLWLLFIFSHLYVILMAGNIYLQGLS